MSKRRANPRTPNRAAACPRVPVCVLDELRAGVPVIVEERSGKHVLVGLDPARPLAARKRKEAAEALLVAAGDELQRSQGAVSADELARRRETRVITPQRPHGETAHYEVVEASQLVSSHDPQSFQPDERYPKNVQERDYLSDVNEQLKVRLGAQTLNPALLLTDTPSPVDGPPLVTRGVPIVLGGNGRSMMLKRAYTEG